MPKLLKQPPTSWDDVAEWYDQLLATDADSYQRQVILPNLLRVIAIRPNERILDLACGQGFFSLAFAQAGATVFGVDLSTELIARARQRVTPRHRDRLTFYVAPAERLPFLPDGSVDKIAIILALQNIEPAAAVITECRRVLKPRGAVFIVLNHPAFRIPKASSWQFEGTKLQYRRVDRYLSEDKVKILMRPGADPTVRTVTFHRPLQTYFKWLGNHGLCVVRLEEWISHRRSQPGPRAAAEDRARKEIPLFLLLQAVKH